jgi:hypothetical protein
MCACGADSLTGDRLGCFNLSIRGHAQCVEYLKGFGVPLLLTGGGGYTVRNVARCWAFETSVVLGESLADELPFNEYMGYYGPDYRLHLHPSNMENRNSERSLNEILETHMSRMREFPAAPNAGIDPARIGGGLARDSPQPVAGVYIGQRPTLSIQNLGIPMTSRRPEPEDLTFG